MALTKADLVDRLTDTEHIGKKEAFDLIEAAFDEIREVLARYSQRRDKMTVSLWQKY